MVKISNYTDVESKQLASYAMKNICSKGRRHTEREHPFRAPFQRDRDRIIHSNAFRRLEYKTQVFIYHEGDHYRTRLTHTIEVAQIARTIARALGLNEDLSEAVALAHDLGHPPFGHTGEEALNQLMSEYGGFEHNLHSLRIVDHMEERYPHYRGLNLTWEVREGIARHGSAHDHPLVTKEFPPGNQLSLEAQIVDLADEIAYNNHDLDDGISSRMIDVAELNRVDLWHENFEEQQRSYPNARFHILKAQTVKAIINMQVTDLIEEIVKQLEENQIKSPDSIKKARYPIAKFSKSMKGKNKQLKVFLKEKLYNHFRVIRMADKATRILTNLFNVYSREPRLLPPHILDSLRDTTKERLICDYIAGMTDRFALEEHKKLFDPHERV